MTKLLKDLSIFVFGLIEILLIFRFVLKLFGASTQSDFVMWIYQNTQPLLVPFLFAFPTPNVNGQFVLEFTTLFAIFAYAFVGYLVQQILTIVDNKNKK